ncbi:MAG: PRD domain-containing protein [Candidatus Cohnella colombiensis]|uniref:PRD domain-containing protein n=1 Tax=Candidatus Cohnella colombiensis TaxID=3121368 RepID=A0AA95EZT1_9BACL|nr:MAG: PRD domain-containing protein [Cohnella sp.]
MNDNTLYVIDRIVGNNVVLSKDESGVEMVLFGKGLGFSSKIGATIASKDERIEKRFRLDDRDKVIQFQSLIEGMDPKVLRISENIIELMESEFQKKVNNKVYLALPSHIQFAVYRLRNKIEIINPFLYETKISYPKEYEVARQAANIIASAFEIEIPEEEVGFLTFHVYSAIENVSVGELVKFTNLIQELVAEIETSLTIHIPRTDSGYIRLITHLRFSFERIIQFNAIDNPFFEDMHQKFKEEYQLALKLAKIMEEHLNTEIPKEEIGYLVMHLYRFFHVHVKEENK